MATKLMRDGSEGFNAAIGNTRLMKDVKEVPVRDSFSTMLIQTTEHCKLRVWEPLKKGKEPFTHEKLAPNAETTISKSLLRLCCKLIIECERNSVSLLTFDSDINIFSNFQAL